MKNMILFGIIIVGIIGLTYEYFTFDFKRVTLNGRAQLSISPTENIMLWRSSKIFGTVDFSKRVVRETKWQFLVRKWTGKDNEVVIKLKSDIKESSRLNETYLNVNGDVWQTLSKS